MTVAPARAPAGNLPAHLTRFVGRRSELTEAKRLLSVHRLVTLTGVGGVGKTRLALRLAADTRRSFPDGVWFVEFDKLRDPGLIGNAVAAALGLREQSAGSPFSTLVEHLAPRHLLVVLDNCEHLVRAVAALADVLLRACPSLRVVATSRESLGMAGEAVLPVPPMPTPDPQGPSTVGDAVLFDAVGLFTDRASAVVPGFRLTEDNYAAVARICHELDGIPLAVELAAVRLRVLSAQQLLAGLTDRFQLLSGILKVGVDRQATLEASIVWSYDLCTDDEQMLWARVSVFSGGFDLDAVIGVCAGNGLRAECLFEIVAGLLDKSILVREPNGPVARYRLLESIREFGVERLRERGEYDDLHRRYRDWYTDLVRTSEKDWIGPRQAQWLARLSTEHANLRGVLEFCLAEHGDPQTALRFAAGLQQYWLARGLLGEGRRWLDRSLAAAPEPGVPRVQALQVNAWLAVMQHDVDAVERLLAEGFEASERVGDDWARALILEVDGFAAIFLNDLPRADENLRKALRIFRKENDTTRIAESLSALATGHGLLGDEKTATQCYEEFVAATKAAPATSFRSYSLWALGLGALRDGDIQRAADREKQSLRIARGMGDRLGTVICLDSLAWIAAAGTEYARAACLFGAADRLWSEVGTSPTAFGQVFALRHGFNEETRRALGRQDFLHSYRAGQDWTDDQAAAYALSSRSSVPKAGPSRETEASPLTPREREIADLVAQGLSNKAIASRLLISQRTAENHVENILAKLGFTSRTQVAVWVAARHTETS
jgi:predicted ATPase/DNA-binding CsgD family transcriptional regulator